MICMEIHSYMIESIIALVRVYVHVSHTRECCSVRFSIVLITMCACMHIIMSTQPEDCIKEWMNKPSEAFQTIISALPVHVRVFDTHTRYETTGARP